MFGVTEKSPWIGKASNHIRPNVWTFSTIRSVAHTGHAIVILECLDILGTILPGASVFSVEVFEELHPQLFHLVMSKALFSMVPDMWKSKGLVTVVAHRQSHPWFILGSFSSEPSRKWSPESRPCLGMRSSWFMDFKDQINWQCYKNLCLKRGVFLSP